MPRLLVALLACSLAACGGKAATPGVGGPIRTVAAPALEAAAPVRVGESPSALAIGFGSVWVAGRDAGTVTRVDAATGRPARTAKPLRAGRGPLAVATGEGAVWVAAADGTITRIDPTRGTAATVARVADPGGIAAGEGGVWVTGRSSGTLTRLDPRSGARTGQPARVGADPSDVVIGGGSVWVANQADGTVSQVSPKTGKPAGDAIRVGRAQTLALASGGGAIWAAKTDTERADAIAIVRIDPGRAEVDGDPVRITGGVPLGLAAGAGSVWVTDPGSLLPGSERPPGLLRLDVRAGSLAGAPARLGPSPSAVAVGEGGVWVATAGDGALTRYTPPSG
jgi:streptogramin lyase